MLCASVRRVAVFSLFSLMLSASAGAPVGAATIFLAVKSGDHATVLQRHDVSKSRKRTKDVSQVILPVEDDPAKWALLTGGIVLIGATMRRKRRMPSVTS